MSRCIFTISYFSIWEVEEGEQGMREQRGFQGPGDEGGDGFPGPSVRLLLGKLTQLVWPVWPKQAQGRPRISSVKQSVRGEFSCHWSAGSVARNS
jgi:hypothetical protein